MARPDELPREYRYSTGWRAGFALAGIASIGLCAAILLAPLIGSLGTGDVARLAMATALGLSGIWCGHRALYARVLILDIGELRIPMGFRTRTLARESIEGYRFMVRHGVRTIEVVSRERLGQVRKDRIRMVFDRDAAFDAWFRGVPNLDTLALASSFEEVPDRPVRYHRASKG